MEESELKLREKITKCKDEGLLIGDALHFCRDSTQPRLLMLIREIYYGEPSAEARQGVTDLN